MHIETARGLGASIVDTAVGPIEAVADGSGPAVLFVHGTPGSWRQLVPLGERLVGEHTVVLPSRPGYGRTPAAVGRTPAEQADAYAALLDTIGAERVAVVGVSGGGPSAAAFAARHADRTASLVLCCPLDLADFPVPGALRLALAPVVGEVLTTIDRARRRRRLQHPAALEAAIRRELTPAEMAGLDDEMRAAVVRFLLSHLDAPAGLAGFRNDVAQIRAAVPVAAGVTTPTLVLHGAADTVVPLAHARHYADAIPGAVLDVLEGAGHGFLLTRPEVLPRLVDFILEHR